MPQQSTLYDIYSWLSKSKNPLVTNTSYDSFQSQIKHADYARGVYDAVKKANPGVSSYNTYLSKYSKYGVGTIGTSTASTGGNAAGGTATAPKKRTATPANNNRTTAAPAKKTTTSNSNFNYLTGQYEAPEGASPLVQGLVAYQNEMNNGGNQLTETGTSHWNRMAAAQKKTTDEFVQATTAPTRERNKPAYSGNPLSRTVGQVQDDVEKSIREEFLPSFDAAGFDEKVGALIQQEQDRAEVESDRMAMNIPNFGAGSSLYRTAAIEKAKDPDKIQKNLLDIINKAGIDKYFMSDAVTNKINELSKKHGVTPEAYAEMLRPVFRERVNDLFEQKLIDDELPRNEAEYILGGITDSLIGICLTKTRSHRKNAAAAAARQITEESGNSYMDNEKPGMLAGATRFGVSVLVDIPAFLGYGTVARGAYSLGAGAFRKGMTRLGWKMAAQTTADELAKKYATMTMAQRVTAGLTKYGASAWRGAAISGMTGAQYGAWSNFLSETSTSTDSSLGQIAMNSLRAGAHEGVAFGAFGAFGGMYSPFLSRFGINGAELTRGQRLLHGAQRAGLSAAGVAAEGGVMTLTNAALSGGDVSAQQYINDVVTVLTMKVATPHFFTTGIKTKLKGLTQTGAGFDAYVYGEDGEMRRANIRLTDVESGELRNSEAGRTFLQLATESSSKTKGEATREDIASAYSELMNDANVSQATKMKLNAAMGYANNVVEISHHATIDRDLKQVLDYSENGTLLSRTAFTSGGEVRAILSKLKEDRKNSRMLNTYGAALAKYGGVENSDAMNMNAITFLRENGYNMSKPGNDPGNARILADFANLKSELRKKYDLYVTDLFIEDVLGGIDKDEARRVMFKDPLDRTDAERALVETIEQRCNDYIAGKGEPHEAISKTQGETKAEEGNLGSDEPDPKVVADVANEVADALTALQEAMAVNDVLREEYKRMADQGMRPVDIYQKLVTESGLTVEELAPLADYINAQAKATGMVGTTVTNIENNVQLFLSQWGYRGKFNGQQRNGEIGLYVSDEQGRTLLVGNGDLDFDVNGRNISDTGDMLVCLDTKTGETVYVDAKSVKYVGEKTAEELGNDRRQELAEKNGDALNVGEATQKTDQAIVAEGEGKPEQGEGGKPEGTTETQGEEQKAAAAQTPGEAESPAAANTPSATEQAATNEAATQPTSALSRIPTSEDGKTHLFTEVDTNTATDGVVEMFKGDLGKSEKAAETMRSKAEKAVETAKKKKVKDGDTIEEIAANQEEHDAAVAEAERKLQQWTKIVNEIKRRKLDAAEPMGDAEVSQANAELSIETDREKLLAKAKKLYGDTTYGYLLDDVEPVTLEEYIAEYLPAHSINWEGMEVGGRFVPGLKQELGFGSRGIGHGADTNSFNLFLAPKGKGESVDTIVHKIWEAIREINPQFDDTKAIKDTLLDMLASAKKPSDITCLTIKNRIKAVEDLIRKEREAYEDEMNRERNEQEQIKDYTNEVDKDTPSVETEDAIKGMQHDKDMANEGEHPTTETSEPEGETQKEEPKTATEGADKPEGETQGPETKTPAKPTATEDKPKSVRTRTVKTYVNRIPMSIKVEENPVLAKDLKKGDTIILGNGEGVVKFVETTPDGKYRVKFPDERIATYEESGLNSSDKGCMRVAAGEKGEWSKARRTKEFVGKTIYTRTDGDGVNAVKITFTHVDENGFLHYDAEFTHEDPRRDETVKDKIWMDSTDGLSILGSKCSAADYAETINHINETRRRAAEVEKEIQPYRDRAAEVLGLKPGADGKALKEAYKKATDTQRAAVDKIQKEWSRHLSKKLGEESGGKYSLIDASGRQRQSLTEKQRKDVETIAKALGFEVDWVDTLVDANGKYRGNRISIAMDAARPLDFVFGHEVTHGVKELGEKNGNPDLYKNLATAVEEALGAKEFDRRTQGVINLYLRNSRYIGTEAAREEAVADSIGELVHDKDLMHRIAYRLDHPTLSKLRDVVIKFLDFFRGRNMTAEEKAAREVLRVIDKTFDDARKIAETLEGSIDVGNGKSVPVKLSIRADVEGVGAVPIEKNEKGNFAIRLADGTEFDADHHVTAEDLKKQKDGAWIYMMNDALELGAISKEKADALWNNYATMLNMFLDRGAASEGGFETLKDTWQYVSETIFKTVAINSDSQYSFSLDVTRICKKNEAVINAISEMQKRYRNGITPEQIIEIYQETQKAGYQVPCPVCYVFTRYLRNGKYATIQINGMRKYGDKLRELNNPEYQDKEGAVQYWVNELGKWKAWMEKNKTAIKNANEDITELLGTVDELGNVVKLGLIDNVSRQITSGTLTEKGMEQAKADLAALNERYRKALNLVSQASLDSWIKNYAIKEHGQGENKTYTLRDDAWNYDRDEFERVVLDLRLTAKAIREYPAIQRYRNSRGAAAGKEITMVSNNDIGDVVMAIGSASATKDLANADRTITNEDVQENLKTDDYAELMTGVRNPYVNAAKETDPQKKADYLKTARRRFKGAMVYAQQQSLRGGQRMWSWSDNIERLAPDVFVNLMQMDVVGGALQSYSKQLEGVALVAANEGYVNGSLMGKGKGWREVTPEEVEMIDGKYVLKTGEYDIKHLDGTVERVQGDYKFTDSNGKEVTVKSEVYKGKDGKFYTLEFDPVVGIDFFGRTDASGQRKKGLMELNNEYDRAGNILVGMNDIHVRAAMADSRIFFIIPWHSSGANNHILNQMYNAIKVAFERSKDAQDYTDVQEEKRLELGEDGLVKNGKVGKDGEETEGNKGKTKVIANQELIDFWRDHYENPRDYNGQILRGADFACGIKGGVITPDKPRTLTPSQTRYRELHDVVLTGMKVKVGKDMKTLPIREAKDYDETAKTYWEEISNDEFLSQAERKIYERVSNHLMTSGDKKYIYPYEYWDENSTYANADVNVARYIEYCRRLGYKPKFAGLLDNKSIKKNGDHGNFLDDPGAHKLLIDRRMYDRMGNFQDLTPVNTDGFETRFVDPRDTEANYDVTRVAKDEATDGIVDAVVAREDARDGGAIKANYDMTADEALAEYKASKSSTNKTVDKNHEYKYERLNKKGMVQPSGEKLSLREKENEDSGTLYESLQNKQDKKSYYETVNILSERIADGRTSLRGISPAQGRRTPSVVLAGLGVIARDRGRVQGLGEGGSKRETEQIAEEWARQNGHWVEESNISGSSWHGRPAAVGSEARVYLSKDGQTVIKLADPYTRKNSDLANFVESVNVFNELFPETAYDVTGITRDADGKFRVVLEQPRVVGKQVETKEYLEDGYSDKVVEFFKEIGLEPVEGDETTFSNSKYYVTDIHSGNVIFSKDGGVHIIDADAKYHGRYKREQLDDLPPVTDGTKFSLRDGVTYFSGGGLVEAGLAGAIDPKAAVEFDRRAVGVYRNNFGEHIVMADVQTIDPKKLVEHIDGEVGYFHASPVCKNFSKAKTNGEETPLDMATAKSTAYFINEVHPRVVTIENVKGYRDSEALKTITDALTENGYKWDAHVYNAADFGAYTNRERLIVRAVREGELPPVPQPTGRREGGWLDAVSDIIDTLPEKKDGVAPWMDERLKASGIDYRNIDKPLYVFGQGNPDGKVPHAFADQLLPTLRTKSGDVIIMPDGRVLRATGRVLARISGLPDSYKVEDLSEATAHRVIGNGVPTQLTRGVIVPLVEHSIAEAEAARKQPVLESDGTKYSLVSDRDELNRLEKAETFEMYSALQRFDEKTSGSPMAGYKRNPETGKLEPTNTVEVGNWYRADESNIEITPEQRAQMDALDASGKTGKVVIVPGEIEYRKDSDGGVGHMQFKLQKTKDDSLWVAYNPYNHTSDSMLNDQFKGAYARSINGNKLFVARWAIPEFEKTDGYQAEYAKNSTGETPWTSGVVNRMMPADKQRTVMLSRYRKLVGEVSDVEAAKTIVERIGGENVPIPYNTIWEGLVEEFAKLGYPISTVPDGINISKGEGKATHEHFLAQKAELEAKYPQARFVDVRVKNDEAFKNWQKGLGSEEKFSFIGEQGATRLDKAEEVTTRLDNLDVARRMEEAKEDAKTIKMATGWERGADGKWRYEMEDVTMANLLDMLDERKTVAPEEDGGYRAEFTLAEIAGDEHPLFKAYPEFAKMPVVVEGKGKSAYTDGKKITINTDAIGKPSVLAHEIQHAIQVAEGFAVGESVYSYGRIVNGKLTKDEQLFISIVRIYDQNREFINKNYGYTLQKLIKSRLPLDFSEDFAKRVHGMNSRTLHKLYERLSKVEDSIPNPFEVYRRISGEVESRNVERRMDMSEGKRRRTLASETEDVSREDQYFLFDDGVEGESHEKLSLRSNDDVISDHIAEVSKKVGAEPTRVNSLDEVNNANARRSLEEGRNVTGWYDEKTGKTYLYMPNIHDRYTAEKTIWHETVGHKGMRGLLGDSYNKFMRNIWMDKDSKVYDDLHSYVREHLAENKFDLYDTIEEYLATEAEKPHGNPGFWNNVCGKVVDAFREVGYRISPKTADVKYLLWLSKNLQNHPNDPIWKARAERVKWRIEHGVADDVMSSNGMFHMNDGRSTDLADMPKEDLNDLLDGNVHLRTDPSTGTAIERYKKALEAHGYMFTEAYFDNMQSLKELMQAVLPEVKIEDIAASENPYLLQNTMQGAMPEMMNKFQRDIMDKLTKISAKCLNAFSGKSKERLREFNLYLIKKSGAERNRVFFVRDKINYYRNERKLPTLADALQTAWDQKKKELGDKLRNGQIRLDEYYKELDDWIRMAIDKTFDPGHNDYSGIHGVYETPTDQPYDDAALIADIMDIEARLGKDRVDELWDAIREGTRFSVDLDYASGINDKMIHDHTVKMFDWYIPMRGSDAPVAEEMYGYITQEGRLAHSTAIGQAIKKAKGHKELSNTNVLAEIGAMANSAVRRHGDMAVKQAFARFIRNHKDEVGGLVTELSIWVEKDGKDAQGKDVWREALPQIPDDATPDEINKIVADFETDMQAKKKNGDAHIIQNKGFVPYKFADQQKRSQHIVDVMIAGRKHRFIVNGNPRAAQAINGLLENKGTLSFFSKINRFMAQMCTTWSPEFVLRNAFRDAEFASANIAAKESASYCADWLAYYASVSPFNGVMSLRPSQILGRENSGLGLFGLYRQGKLDMSNRTHRYFKEFMENGGTTGWVQVLSMEEWTKKAKVDILHEKNPVKVGQFLKDFIFGNIEHLNEAAENMARFATYCASRAAGRGIVRSAYDAKEVSTNFNRHGSGSAVGTFVRPGMTGGQETRRDVYSAVARYMRNFQMFFNAGAQSTNLLVRNLKSHPVRTTAYMMAIPFCINIAVNLLNRVLIGKEDESTRDGVKDPLAELSSFTRRNNLCVYIGKGKFLTVPIAIEERAFYGLGDLVSSLTFMPELGEQKNAWLDATGCLSQLLPGMDYLNGGAIDKDPWKTVVKSYAPTQVSPIVEWMLNSDWKGSTIERRSDFTVNDPAWMKAKSNTPSWFINLNQMVNAATNDVDPGNASMKGNSFLDDLTNPSFLEQMVSGYLGGTYTFATRTIKNSGEVNDIPFKRVFINKPSDSMAMQRTRSKWYNYRDRFETTQANVEKLKRKTTSWDERIGNIAAYERYMNSKDSEAYRIYEDANRQLERIRKVSKRISDPDAIKLAEHEADLIMQQTVQQLDSLYGN